MHMAGIPDFHKYLGAEFNLLQDPKLAPLAAKHGLSPAQVRIAARTAVSGCCACAQGTRISIDRS